MRFRPSTFLPIITCFSLALVAPASAQESGCSTSKCHPTMGKAEWVHGPVAVGECGVCHREVDKKDHKFELRAAGDELCFACHESSRDMMLREHAHTPVAEGNCVGCHDPHQSENRYSLKGAASDLCLQCHSGEPFQAAFIHGPVAGGECNVCHNPHASDHPYQLVSSPDDLCFLCHDEQAGVLDKRHVHAPVTEGCTSCHNPHSNNARYMLPQDPPELCIGCHSDLDHAATVANGHPPAVDGDCTTCHDPHSADNPRLSPLPPRELCFACHDEMESYITSQSFLHGPVREGDCSACHNPHGSDHHRMLKQFFPAEFYAPYRPENYAMCFECHNGEIARTEKTTTLTDFRDGDRNLHYVHVNKETKGRSCRACHQVHASSQEKHIRTSVPFGKIDWELPVTFTKTEDGGSCQVGCHAPKQYSRK